MSILIKGMETPQKCGQCKLFHTEQPMYCMAVEGHRTVGAPYGMPRPDWCPLVEIHTPHGRLGDLDALKAQYKYGEADSEDERLWMMNIRRAITNAPTIIEAEGETDA